MDGKNVTWKGLWRNQYGSTLKVTDDGANVIKGTFTTELKDSGFYGAELPVAGIHGGDCMSFTFARHRQVGDIICTFTGLRRDGKLLTVFHVVADSAARPVAVGEPPKVEKTVWAHAVITNADTFERVDPPPA